MEAKKCDCCDQFYSEDFEKGIKLDMPSVLHSLQGKGRRIYAQISIMPFVKEGNGEPQVDLCPQCKIKLTKNVSIVLRGDDNHNRTDKKRQADLDGR